MVETVLLNEPQIQNLQTMLRTISQTDPRVLPVIPDGIYGSNTFASVLSFQSSRGLAQTGEVDRNTWDAIVATYDEAAPLLTLPGTTPAWSIGQSVQPGQFNYHIYLVQAMLAALSDFFPEFPTPALSGVLDDATQNGLRFIQAASSLPQTGVLDSATWYYLNGLYRAMTKDGKKQGTV